MSDSAGERSGPWQAALDEWSLESQPAEPPKGEETGEFEWFELYSKFATRGFVRALVGRSAEASALRVQFALPTASTGGRLLSAVRAEFSDVLGGDWRVVTDEPEWEIGARLVSAPDAETARTAVRRLRDLSTVAKSGSPSDPAWLADRLGTEPAEREASTEPEQTSTSSPPAEPETNAPGGEVFESIGDGSSDEGPSPALSSAGLERWKLLETDGAVEARIWIDTPLASDDVDRIGRELTHSLRSRYDISARPKPVDEPNSSGGTELRLRAKPARSGLDGPENSIQVREDLESYLKRLSRFEDLGVDLAAVLGLDADGPSQSIRSTGTEPGPERSGDGSDRAGRRKRGSGRRDASTREPDGPPTASNSERSIDSESGGSIASRSGEDAGADASRSRPTDETSGRSESMDSENVVLDLGEEPSVEPPDPTVDEKPESGLEPGNYRDPRLMREDATTSLVDVVLRHPGYAEEKMGHNLSILLDIDFPDAMDLVQKAPSIIAWGVGRDRAIEFEQFIEHAGGKVVLVEPDSLKD